MSIEHRHLMPFGAEIDDAGTHFRLWAPNVDHVDLLIERSAEKVSHRMNRNDDGWFALRLEGAGAGTRYRFVIDGGLAIPDPASRFQPDDVHGASEVFDPRQFDWPDAAWRGRPWEETVLYELHVGSFTAAGTFAGVQSRLDDLVALGITAIELMPVADFPGRRDWGYNGVFLYAPDSRYGRPDDLKALIAAAHGKGLMVFLDVVYNHFGPEGNYLGLYAPEFFTDRHATPWGAAIDFTMGGRWVRDFFIENALFWLEEYHLDGLRFDAVHAIFDESPRPILEELAERVRARFDGSRHVHLVLENDDNAAHYLARRPDGRPRWYTAQWNDDFHHACHVIATGERESYYEDYADAPIRGLGRALAEGFVYQGEASCHRGGRPRGTASGDLPPTAFVNFLQNHDQIGNRAFGERLGALTSDAAMRALIAITLLAPSPPMLFMGEEWDASAPFQFFCDFGPELADAVRDGRRREFAHFAAFRDAAARARIPDPMTDATFTRAVLDRAEADLPPHRARRDYYRDLLALRRREIMPRLFGIAGHAGAFAQEGERGLRASWQLGDGARLSLCANLAPTPLTPETEAPTGRVLFTTHDDWRDGDWPAWFVRWLIDK
ncbi:MAG: malto-oligosyltrehalose trehalohydrolase [Stellaceae bacterium]